ncbi:MAG: tRNA (adenosine(37)-N6)-dimethylallyltransferase MiaA [Candidatus Omnitrophica bacterium]|nr:tRNA (adenosine(37)-N6)-dimethylallyltransferase MiaA [Candidatus Omnitrophota bacterium]
MRTALKKIIFLVGPTAIGKTKVACALAKKIKAEIISCDSMQIYRGMDIITSKPPPDLRKEVPHHLIDIISPEHEYNVFQYRTAALKKVKEIIKKGKTPLFVGGTGLYVSALVDGIFKQKTENKIIRQRLYKLAKIKGNQYLYERLKKVDPQAIEKIHPSDLRRIVRALEVFEVTGQPISELQKRRSGLWGKHEIKIFCLNIQRNKLYQRINHRVEEMFKNGLLSEAKRLLKLRLSQTAYYCIGIRELKGYFDGRYSLEEAKEQIKKNTRRYAKRQLTWFRKDKRIIWVNIKDKETPKEIAIRLWKRLS